MALINSRVRRWEVPEGSNGFLPNPVHAAHNAHKELPYELFLDLSSTWTEPDI